MVNSVSAMAANKIKYAKSSLVKSAAIFTWIFLLNMSQVHAEGQRCYVCGPRSTQWYSNGPPPTCNDFKQEPQYEVTCGKGYDYCAIIKMPGSQEISRVCSESHETKGCVSKACAKTKTLFTVCTCNGPLCNGESSYRNEITTIIPETPTSASQEVETTTTKTAEETTTPKADAHENIYEKNEDRQEKMEENKKQAIEVENPPPENPTKTEHDNLIQNDNTRVDKTKQPKHERDLTNSNEVKNPETITTHSLPSPEALGQEHQKKLSQQGAPVDDEEDAVEGSGSKAEVDKKEHMQTTPTTTTTEKPTTVVAPNGAPTFQITMISFWTFVTLMIVS